MAQRRIVTWICDLCGGTDNVSTHTVVVDNHAVEFEADPKCWQAVLTSIAKVDKVGRQPGKAFSERKPRQRKPVPFPGQSWDFTFHALERMGQRKLNPVEVVAVAESPEVTAPGNDLDSEIRMNGGIRVTVDAKRRVIITAAYRNEETDPPQATKVPAKRRRVSKNQSARA